MNYLVELKAFYDGLELNPLPSPAIALWHALMSIANKTGWQQEFTVASSILVLKSGLNAQAVKRARNRLEQDGYITWKSRGGNQAALYHINSLVVQNEYKNVPQCEPQSEPQCEPQSEPQFEPQSVPQCEPQSEPINKHKQHYIIPPISPVERFEDFWSCYPKKYGRAQTEKAYCNLIIGGIKEDDLIIASENYGDYCKKLEIEQKYIKNPSNFLIDYIFNEYSAEKYNPPKRKDNNKFNNFQQNKYDFDALEKELLCN